jgi:HEAT repeat protein
MFNRQAVPHPGRNHGGETMCHRRICQPRFLRIAASVAALAAWLCLAAPSLAAEAKPGEPAAPPVPPAIAPLLDAIQAQDAAAAEKLARDLVKLGPQGIADLCGLVVAPGKIDDSKARFALHGLAMHTARPGAETERMMVCEAFRKVLAGPAPAAVKGFFLRQLRLMGCPKAVPAISEFLLNEELSEYAAQALVSIGGEEATAALRQALPKATGKCRLTLIQDLGVVRDAKAAPDLLKAAADPDREIRLAALFSLANIGDAAAADTLMKATDVEGLYEKSKATDAVLLLARRLGEAGKKKEAEAIYRTLWQTRADPRDRHVRCAALRGLATVLGAGAMDDVAAAMKSDDLQIRAAAVEVAATLPGEDVTAKLIEQMKALPPASRADMLGLLARRGGAAAETAILDAMKDADEGVRLAAVTAAGALKGDKAAPALLALVSSDNSKLRDAARRSLERVAGDPASAAIAAAIPSAATPQAKRDLLGVLMVRGAKGQVDAVAAIAAQDPDAGVRQAAMGVLEYLAEEKHVPLLVGAVVKAKDDGERGAAEKALGALCGRLVKKDECVDKIMPAMGGADVPAKAALVRVLAKAGGPKALAAVRAAVKEADATIQEAGVRALADWPDASVAPDLMEIAKTGVKQNLQVLALRGYVRLANVPADRAAAEKLKMYEAALAAAKRPEDKKMVLGAMGEMKTIAALRVAAALVADETLKEEAAATAVRVARNMGDDVRSDEAKADVRAAMQKALEILKGDNVRKEAQGVMQRLDRK